MPARRTITRLAPASRCAAALSRAVKDAGAFKCDIDAELLVRQFGRIAHRRHLDRAGADIDGVAIDLDFARVAAMHRIIAQEMRIGLDRAEIVDGDDL